MFVLNSDITIGDFRFSGVHDVRIQNSVHSIVTMAYIKLPAIAGVIKADGSPVGSVVTGTRFKEGDKVTIKLGYNGDLRTEFSGFVRSADLNMPVTIVCEGYSWLLKRNKINISKTSIAIKDLLKEALVSTPIKVVCHADVHLNNVQVNGTGTDLINTIQEHTDHALTIFFKEPDLLWCGDLRTQYAKGKDVLQLGNVQYRSGFNILEGNTLKRRSTDDDPLDVTYSKKEATGAVLTATSGAFKKAARHHSKLLNQVKDKLALKLLADEKAYKDNYTGFEGAIRTFLVPFVRPGYVASFTDKLHGIKDARHLVESVTTQYGINGARRSVEIGPLVGFANNDQL